LELAGAIWGPFWIDFTGPNSDQQPWGETAYQKLRRAIETAPVGDQALERIGRLACANSDKAPAPCDPAAPPTPPGVSGFEAAASDEDYRKALAGTLKSIVCAGNDDGIFVLRGGAQGAPGPTSSRLAAAGGEATALIDFIMSPACPVSTKLTAADRATLQKIKQDALKKPGG
jgi:hypothetical protein